MKTSVRLYLANEKEYRKGTRISKWFELPVSKEKIFRELNIHKGDFQEECLILVYEAPFKVTLNYSLNELNYFAESLKNLPSWISNNLDELVGGRGDEFLFEVLLSGGRCFQQVEGVDNYTSLGKYLLKKYFSSVTSSDFIPFLERYFDYEGFAKECNRWGFNGSYYYFIDGLCIELSETHLM